ncbi:MAG: hypothetical protein JNJ83_16950 [Verrucomicrobiaceae bacterium]|nr:hypothetical protein [Verrucomicrobiaceae bacterium]
MGLFSAAAGYQPEDYRLALRASKRVVEWWNGDHSERYGFKLEIALGSLEESCSLASNLFDDKPYYFARPPGPFKRVAAFLVYGCLNPFFDFDPIMKKPVRPSMPGTPHERRVWTVRFLLMTLPELFGSLKVHVNGKDEKVDWLGFPSDHFELEFMNWLKWLDRCGNLGEALPKEFEWEAFQRKRYARMVMATAMALEASSYADPSAPRGLQGKIKGCMANLTPQQIEDLTFSNLPGN